METGTMKTEIKNSPEQLNSQKINYLPRNRTKKIKRYKRDRRKGYKNKGLIQNF